MIDLLVYGVLAFVYILETGPWHSKTDFCASVGISPQILSNLIARDSTREIPKSLLIGLARLNYNITWVLYGVGPERNYTSTNEEVLALRKQVDVLKEIVVLENKLRSANQGNSSSSGKHVKIAGQR
jgi:hypothetical protein